MEFLFFIGRTHELAHAELETVLHARYNEASLETITPTIIKVSSISLEEAQELQGILGGTLKIVQIEEKLNEPTTEELEAKCVAILENLGKEKQKIWFGLAEIGRDTLKAVDHYRIKESLKDAGFTVRFVEGTRAGLGASVLIHQNVEECVIVREKGTTYFGYTIAVQNIDDWTVRDRMKPAADRQHGMLPPKIARILVNLALPAGGAGKRLLDPFCGTGTVVMEAMMLGYTGVGTDLRVEAVGQTQKNASWLITQYGLSSTFAVATSDVTHLTQEMIGGRVDAVACEGFLGALKPKPGAVPNIFKGLEKLYLGAFKQLALVIAPGTRIAIALPRIEIKKTVYSLSPLVDRLQSYGYNSVFSGLIYDRPDATTKREVFVLEYKK